MRDEAVPYHRLEGLGVGRDAARVDRRHDDHAVADLLRVAAVAAHHAEDLHAALLRFLEPGDDVGADILLQVAAADREDEHRVVRAAAAGADPGGEDRLPAL